MYSFESPESGEKNIKPHAHSSPKEGRAEELTPKQRQAREGQPLTKEQAKAREVLIDGRDKEYVFLDLDGVSRRSTEEDTSPTHH